MDWQRSRGEPLRSLIQRLLGCVAVICAAALAQAGDAERLPDSKPLDWEGELADRMMDGLHRFIERKIDESVDGRPARWQRDFTSEETWLRSTRPNRDRLEKILGLVEPRVPPRMERFGDDRQPALVWLKASLRNRGSQAAWRPREFWSWCPLWSTAATTGRATRTSPGPISRTESGSTARPT